MGIVSGHPLQCGNFSRPGCQDKIGFLPHQFLRKPVQAIRVAIRMTRFENEVLAVNISTFAQAFHQRSISAGIHQRLARTEVQITDAPEFALLSESANRCHERTRTKPDQ